MTGSVGFLPISSSPAGPATSLPSRIQEKEGFVDVPANGHIGYGHNQQAHYLDVGGADWMKAQSAAARVVGEDVYRQLSVTRQNVLAELAYLMGEGGLLGFKKFMAAIHKLDWAAAGHELQDSLLPEQIGGRLVELRAMIEGRKEWPND